MSTKLEPPSSLSKAEKKAFRRLADALVERGIDPASRQELLADFVRLEARLHALRSKHDMPPIRALNVASAERRRLHESLFKGGGPIELVPTPAQASADARQAAADSAWQSFYRGEKDRLSEVELEARYGEPSMKALIFDTDERAAAFATKFGG